MNKQATSGEGLKSFKALKEKKEVTELKNYFGAEFYELALTFKKSTLEFCQSNLSPNMFRKNINQQAIDGLKVFLKSYD